jgi:hypothetical protein
MSKFGSDSSAQAFEVGYLVDFIGVERSRSDTDAGNPKGDEEQPLFH